MTENLEKFNEQLKADEALREKYAEAVNAVSEEERTLDKAVEIITGLGYEVTAEELQTNLQAQELSDTEMENAPGGARYIEVKHDAYCHQCKKWFTDETDPSKRYVKCPYCGTDINPGRRYGL